MQLESPQLLRNVYRSAKKSGHEPKQSCWLEFVPVASKASKRWVLSMRRLRTIILSEMRSSLPSVTQVYSSCLPPNLKNKSDEDLQEL
ncbi:MAG: hypothetical protein ACI8UP_004834 [Porticoccaceae bacterium]